MIIVNEINKSESPEYIKGYHAGMYQGYHIALEDFKAGLRSVWKKDESGNYLITEKYHFVDQDEAAMSGVKFKAGKEEIVLSPEQIQKFTDRTNQLLNGYFSKNPKMIGKFHPHVFLVAPGANTKNWGTIESWKIVILKKPFGIRDSIPQSEILFFVDYDL